MARRHAKNCRRAGKYPAGEPRPRGRGGKTLIRYVRVAVVGLLVVGLTSLASTLTTAYLMRPPAPTAPDPDPEPATESESRPPIIRVAPPRRPVIGPHKTSRRPAPDPRGEVIPTSAPPGRPGSPHGVS